MTEQTNSNPQILGQVSTTDKELVISPVTQKTSMLVLKTITGLVLIAIAFTLIINGLKNLSSSSDEEINKTDNSIEQSLGEIKDSDFSDNLEINFNDTSALPATTQIDQSLSDIDNVLKDINNQADFKDIDNISFNQ